MTVKLTTYAGSNQFLFQTDYTAFPHCEFLGFPQCYPKDATSYQIITYSLLLLIFENSKSHWLFASSLWRHPVPTIRHDKCHRRCKNPKGRYLNSTYLVNVKTYIPPKIIAHFTEYAGQHVYCAASFLLCLFLPKGLCSRQ
jgi:hypothetical protein